MNESGSVPQPSTRAHRYRRHEIVLAEGGRLVLHRDGSIDHIAEDGSVAGSWDVDHPDWARHALRFGITPQAGTVAPRPRSEPVGRIRP